MNPFQKALAKEFKKYKKELEEQIKLKEEDTKEGIKFSKVGTEVVIDTWGGIHNMSYVLRTKCGNWQLTDLTRNRQRLLEMIKENGWILVEPEAVQ